MDSESMLNQLRDIQKEWDDADPLLQKGVGRDWVAVVNPEMLLLLCNYYDVHYSKMGLFSNMRLPEDKASVVMGRPVFIENRAGMGAEYMTREMYTLKYPTSHAPATTGESDWMTGKHAERIEALRLSQAGFDPDNEGYDDEADESETT